MSESPDETSRILIVDDEPANLDVLSGLLKTRYSVMGAKSGEQDIARATGKLRPDLVLLDVMMPDMDGFEVCRRLKADPRTRDIPILFVTALSDVTDETKGIELGAVDYVLKPISVPIVMARVKGVLARQQLRKQLDRMREMFTAMIVHDMRNPLTAIAGLAAWLEEEESVRAAPSVHEAINQILASAYRVLDMAREMLDVTQLQQGRLPLMRSNADLSTVLKQMVQEQTFLAGAKGVRLDAEIESDLVAYLDAAKIGGVVVNLIGNALKFTPPGGTVSVRARRDVHGDILVSVQDTGPGIPPDHASRIFAPWEQVSDQTADVVAGYGLGLAICRMTVEAHGGKIELVRETNGGAHFRFSLPISAPAAI